MIVRVHYPNPFAGGFHAFTFETGRRPEPGDLHRAVIPHPAEGDSREIVEITHVAEAGDEVEAVGIVRLDALGDIRVLSIGGVWNYLPVVADIDRPEVLGILRRLFQAIPDAGEGSAADDLAVRVDPIGQSFKALGERRPELGLRIKNLVTIIKGRTHLSALQDFFDAALAAKAPEGSGAVKDEA